MENNRDLSRDEVIRRVDKRHGDGHLLDLLKRMPILWTLSTIVDVVPDRYLAILLDALDLTENDIFFAAEESMINLTTSAAKNREKSELNALLDMTTGTAVALDKTSKKTYEDEINRITGAFNDKLVKLVKDWIEDDSIIEDDDFDEDEEDDEDFFDDEDLFEDDEDEFDEDDADEYQPGDQSIDYAKDGEDDDGNS